MGRTPLFRRLVETLRAARAPRPAEEARELVGDRHGFGRRELLKLGAVSTAALTMPASLVGCIGDGPSAEESSGASAAVRKITADIGIVGAGIAGLACAYDLQKAGAVATLHDANDHAGGRMWSMGPLFPGPVDWLGQTIERGGELIDTSHKTIQGYIQEFGLAREDISKPSRPTQYLFDGVLVPESDLIAEYRALVDAVRDDVRLSSASPTAAKHNDYDVTLDRMSLAEWLDARGAGPRIAKLLRVAYTIEYGIEPEEMSALAFLLYIKGSRASKLHLFGSSDERYHVVGGNQQVPAAIAARLAGPQHFGRSLLAVKKLSDGRIELTFDEGGRTVTARHDAVVLAIPFNLLRTVALDASLALPPAKRDAIARVVYGANSKLMVGFQGRPWIDLGGSGLAYSDRAHLQNSWETNPSLANATRGVLTDYTGGRLSRSLSPATAQAEAGAFLDDLDAVYPGAKARARRSASGAVVCHLEHWPANPRTRGAYSANATGYFTTICGNEAPPVGNLYFAGETTDSFYAYQGFMEGGANSGKRAAGEIVRDFG